MIDRQTYWIVFDNDPTMLKGAFCRVCPVAEPSSSLHTKPKLCLKLAPDPEFLSRHLDLVAGFPWVSTLFPTGFSRICLY